MQHPSPTSPTMTTSFERPRRHTPSHDAPTDHLADGTPVVVRPLRTQDASLLARGIASLSNHARFLRFGTLYPHRKPHVLRHLCAVDGRHHGARVALHRGALIGHAQWVRERDDPSTAELAAFVLDAFQGRGLGSTLIRRTAEDARRQGIAQLAFYVLPTNRSVLAMTRRWGASLAAEDGMVRGSIPTERLASTVTRP